MKRLRVVNLAVLIVLSTAWIGILPVPVQAQSGFDCATATGLPQTECEALVALYEATDGDNWNNNTGWLTTSTPCSWYGVACGDEQVTSLHLVENNLSGDLPPEISNLSALTSLGLRNNDLTALPPEIGNLPALMELDLSVNVLTTLPPEIGNLSALMELNLSDNDLTALPPEMGNLSALTELQLFNNDLTALPPEIGNLSALTHLDLYSNNLTALPPEFWDLTALTHLGLGGNSLTALPPEIGNLSALTELNLSGNNLTTLPSEFWDLTALTSLGLGGNSLTALPPEIGNLSALTELYLGWNNLTALPPEFWDLTALTYLNLDGNSLTALPPEIGNLSALTYLGLYGNSLTALPPEFWDLTALTHLGLSGNSLTALLPEIGNLSALTYLGLGENSLTALPPEIGNLSTLTTLNLYSNNLTTLPPEIGNLSALTHLGLFDNSLTILPPEIGNLSALTNLILFDNSLTTLPPEIGNLTALTWLELSRNALTTLPPEIGNLTALTELDLPRNNLTALPPEIGNLSAMECLHLNYNPLSGELPVFMTSLTSLSSFDFSSTEWCVPTTGPVPTWLASIPSVTGSGLVCTDTRTPIVFIPGIMGSRLFNTVDGQEREVWADPLKILGISWSLHHPLRVLELDSSGISPARNEPAYTSIHTVIGTSGILTQVLFFNFYGTIIQHFESKGYTENVDFWVFPYDWRKDLGTSADDLDTLIQSIPGDQQVYIVAHSMGGLVARRYISNSTRAESVKRAVLLGTPFLGTPKAFLALQEGICINPLCLPSKAIIKALVPNYPAFYQIMPSEAYFRVKGGGFYGLGLNIYVAGRCKNCLTFDETYLPSVTSNLNVPRAADARQFHATLDTQNGWNGVPVDIIGGQGQVTIAGIYQFSAPDLGRLNWHTFHVPMYNLAGDGTVTFLSVSLANDSTGINLRGTASFRAFDSSHGDLVKKAEILEYVDGLLDLDGTQGIAQSSLQTLGTVAPTTSAQIVGYGVSAIHTYDESGYHTGPSAADVDDTEQAIPGSAYFHQYDMSTVGLIGGRTYTVTIVPTGVRPVDITLVRSTITETLTSTLYLGIDATAQSRITLVGDPYAVDTWHWDVTGIGTEIQEIAPTTIITPATVVDVIAPTTTTISLAGTVGPKGWYISPVTVTLSASDNITGTGISRIEYAFSNDRRVRTYTGPFVADPAQVGVLYAIAMDGMGNTQPTFSQARIGPEKIYLPLVLKRT